MKYDFKILFLILILIVVGTFEVLAQTDNKLTSPSDTIKQKSFLKKTFTRKNKASKSLTNTDEKRQISKLNAFFHSATKINLSERKRKLLSIKAVKNIKQKLIPGDILLKRNEMQFVNLGVPGFWTHTAIYIGGKHEINQYFEGEAMFGSMTPFDYIKKHYPKVAHKINLRKNLVIEAIGDGVVINRLERLAKADYFAALRTNLSKEDLFNAIISSFTHYKKPYDYLFSFDSDDAIICSELVFKAFESSLEKEGYSFNMSTLYGSPFLSPNDIAVQFNNELSSEKPTLKLVVYHNGLNAIEVAPIDSGSNFSYVISQ